MWEVAFVSNVLAGRDCCSITLHSRSGLWPGTRWSTSSSAGVTTLSQILVKAP